VLGHPFILAAGSKTRGRLFPTDRTPIGVGSTGVAMVVSARRIL
jgi:hypothetical protein